MKHKQILAISILVLSIFGASGAARMPQDGQYRLAHANGDGKLRVGREEFKIGSVVVKLLDDRKAEITLVSDITFFLTGTWSQNGESQDSFDVQITVRPANDARHEQEQAARQSCGKEEHTGQPAGEHALLVHPERASRHRVLSAGGMKVCSALELSSQARTWLPRSSCPASRAA